jgi:hypothetical protein
MPGSAAFAPRGTQLLRAGVLIAEVKKIQKTGSKQDLADVTNMDSPSFFREFLPTLNDSGELSFDCNLIPGNASQQALLTDFNTQAKTAYTVQLPPDGLGNPQGKWDFNGFVTTDDFDLPIDKEGTKAVKIKITGPVTFTPNV